MFKVWPTSQLTKFLGLGSALQIKNSGNGKGQSPLSEESSDVADLSKHLDKPFLPPEPCDGVFLSGTVKGSSVAHLQVQPTACENVFEKQLHLY